jgi:Uncharacterised nucleotidyltransferase
LPEDRFLLPALRDPAVLTGLGEPAWRDLLARARASGLLVRLGRILTERGLDQIPEKARVRLAEAACFVRRNQTDLRFEVNRVSRALAHLGTSVILLKGAAYLFAGLPPRHSHFAYDLDILVPRQHLECVEHALRAAGWQSSDRSPHDDRYYREWMHEIPPLWHPDRLFAVDVHHTILPTTSRYKPDTQALFASAVPLRERSLRVLCPTDMVLHAAVHLFTEEFISGLRQLAVLHDLLEHFGRDDPFWDELLERSHRHGLERTLFYLIRYSGRVFATDMPARITTAVHAHRPNAVALAIMDAAVMSALQPALPDEARPGRRIAVWVLYLRSHWLKMPPLLLARHLAAKLIYRVRGRFRLPSASAAVQPLAAGSI